MEEQHKLMAVFEYVSDSDTMTGFVPAMPQLPPVIGTGLREAQHHLKSQLRTYFKANFPHADFLVDTVLIFPRPSRGANS